LYFFKHQGRKYCIDATFSKCLGRLVNDSPDKFANSYMKVIDLDEKPRLCLFAKKEILPETEIRYSYNAENLWWRKKLNTLEPTVAIRTENPSFDLSLLNESLNKSFNELDTILEQDLEDSLQGNDKDNHESIPELHRESRSMRLHPRRPMLNQLDGLPVSMEKQRQWEDVETNNDGTTGITTETPATTVLATKDTMLMNAISSMSGLPVSMEKQRQWENVETNKDGTTGITTETPATTVLTTKDNMLMNAISSMSGLPVDSRYNFVKQEIHYQ